MTKIILSGCSGKMGHVVSSVVFARSDCKIVAGFDIVTKIYDDFPIFKTPGSFTGDADVIIDFSHPAALENLISYSAERKIPIVLATTGYTSSEIDKIKMASQNNAIFYSANMSLGINLIIELAKKAAAILGNDFDIEIIEKHHNLKIDAPSGTALMIADSINEQKGDSLRYTYDRHSSRKKREHNELGIHAIRGGTIVGEHEVIFAGRDETITLTHSAASKEIFVVGAVNAAIFIKDKPPGLYNMGDLIS